MRPTLRELAAVRVVLVPCSATKRRDKGTMRADVLYTGDLFVKALLLARCLEVNRSIQLEQGRATGMPVETLILSAKHGVLRPDEVIEPYDAQLDDLSHAERQAWGRRVAEQLADVAGQRVLCLAGRSYWEPVPGSEHWIRPLVGLGIGQQKAELMVLANDVKHR